MKQIRKPLVSIIVPSFNQGKFIRETIESCLTQDYRPLEVIVVDGASTDKTIAILHEYDHVPEVRWISEPDSGVAEAVNKGFAMACGEIAGIQSSDDAYLPGAVSQAVASFLAHRELGIVYGDIICVDGSGKELRRNNTESFSIENFLSTRTLIAQPAAFFNLNLAKRLGGWDSAYFTCDTDLWLRMVYRAPARKVDSYWGKRRLHDLQRDTQASKIVESYARMIDESQDIANSSRRLRRAAYCGKHVVAAGYNPTNSRIARFYHYWCAFLAFPEISRVKHIAAKLFPGYWFWRRCIVMLFRGGATIRRTIWPRTQVH